MYRAKEEARQRKLDAQALAVPDPVVAAAMHHAEVRKRDLAAKADLIVRSRSCRAP